MNLTTGEKRQLSPPGMNCFHPSSLRWVGDLSRYKQE